MSVRLYASIQSMCCFKEKDQHHMNNLRLTKMNAAGSQHQNQEVYQAAEKPGFWLVDCIWLGSVQG